MNKIKEIDDICRAYNIKNYVINKDGSLDVDGNVDLSKKNLKFLLLKFNIIKGYFDLSLNSLSSLKNSPVYVGGVFSCFSNQITSLKYSPKEIKSHFNCGYNKLKTLECGPEKIGGAYYCYKNYLITLKFLPEYVNGDFKCWNNELTSLKYSPRKINGDFDCSHNELTSLEYGPEIVYGNYDCSFNKLKDLKGCAKRIKGYLHINNNSDLYTLDGLTYCYFKDIICEDTIFYNIWKLFKNVSKIELFNEMDIIREDSNSKPAIILDRLNEFLDIIGKPTVEKVEGYINI